MSDATIQLGCWLAAFWVALVGQLRADPERTGSLRPLLGLVLGAAAAHLGWLALHPEAVRAAPLRLLAPGSGFTLLAFPLGVLAAAFGLRSRERDAWLGAALGSLPLAFAVAKLGCLAAGCCAGRNAPALVMLGLGAAHPVPLYESAGFVAWGSEPDALRHAGRSVNETRMALRLEEADAKDGRRP